MSHLRYLRTVLRHKWFVLICGLRVGNVPLRRLLWHDLSKFSRAEWGPYVRRFGGGCAGAVDHSDDPDEWKLAFMHHWHHNPHHWEHWLPAGEFRYPVEIPTTYVYEMVADWMAAGRAYTGTYEVAAWYERNRARIILHRNTRRLVEELIRRHG